MSSSSGSYAGPYRLMDSLGKGGLATVKVGLDFSTGHKVAVKIVDKVKLSNPREQVSMAREITIMKLLKHTNILRLYDVYENQEKIFLILDIYEGGDLYSHLTKYGAMRPSEAVILFRQIMKGVEFCHKNLVVHRDLKPENLLLSSDKKTLVLSDFGLSTGMAGSRTLLKTRCGTVHYISPEVAKGEPYVGMASDVWSCGIILFAMVTATLPFDGESSIVVLKKIVKGDYIMPAHLPADLKDLIRKMLELDPHLRITIPIIKKHPWFKLGADKEDLVDEPLPMEEPFTLNLEELKKEKPILENLKLLGWEEDLLMDDLLSLEMNQAKVFYKLLHNHKQNVRQRGRPSAAAATDQPRRRASSTENRMILMTTAANRKSAKFAKEKEPPEENKENHPETEKGEKRKKPIRGIRRPVTLEKHSGSPEDAQRPPRQPRQRAATVGDGTRPDVKVTGARSGWDVSPSLDPNAKIYTVESKKSINQILDNLKVCFGELALELSEKKLKKDTVKLKGRLSAGSKGKKTQVIVEVKMTENGNTVNFKRAGKSSKKDEFQEVCKKIEETLIV